MSDQIIVKGLKISAKHGVFDFEKQNEQLFILDIILSVSLAKAGQSDVLEDTVSYADVCNVAQRVMQENCCNLIERAAQLVCDAVFGCSELIEAIDLTIKKPQAPVSQDIEYPAVRIVRQRAR